VGGGGEAGKGALDGAERAVALARLAAHSEQAAVYEVG